MILAHRLIAVTLAFAVLGCHTVSSSDEDGRDDAFLHNGKADTGGVTEGSPQAAAVLKLANTASEELLSDPTDGVGLGQKAVDNIMNFRVGDDSVPGTDDDGVFHKLAELDAIPFVGPLAFAKLLGYAEAHNVIVRPAAMTQGRTFFGTAVGNDGRVYVAGGFGAKAPLADAEVYDPNTNTWAAIAPMSTPRAYVTLVRDARGHLIAIGGYSEQTEPRFLSSVEEYDPNTNKWSPMMELPDHRYVASAVMGGNGTIYLFGGINDQGTIEPALLLTSGQIWKPAPEMPTPRSAMGAVMRQDGRIYTFGGVSAANAITTAAEAFDAAAGRWSVLPAMPHRTYAPATTSGADGQLVVIGGWDQQARNSFVAFDPATNAWAERPSLPYQVYGASAVAVNGQVLLLGGTAGSETLARVASFDPATSTWTTSDAPN